MEKKYLELLKRSKLFAGTKVEEISAMLTCLSAVTRKYKAGSYVYRFGEKINTVGMVLAGRVEVIKEDYWGNKNIVSVINPGMAFAESYACTADAPMGVSVEAVEDSTVLLMDVKRILNVCSSSCVFHSKLISNMVASIASNNLMINEKLSIMTQRSTRKKLLQYFSAESMRQGSPSFVIPFDRQQLADYISVDRSAMSSELSRMKKEGLLEFSKNHFRLLHEIEEV